MFPRTESKTIVLLSLNAFANFVSSLFLFSWTSPAYKLPFTEASVLAISFPAMAKAAGDAVSKPDTELASARIFCHSAAFSSAETSGL